MAANKSKEERQHQILEAALEVFVKKGYSETRMSDIVDKSGLSKGAIYHYYNSKRDLFLSLIDHWETHTFPDFYSKDDEKSASEILRGFVSEIIDTFQNRKYVFLAELEFWALSNRDEEIRSRTKQLYAKILSLFEKVIQKGISDGEFDIIDPKKSALVIMTSLQGVIWFTIFEHQDFTVEEYLNDVMDQMILGFKQPLKKLELK
ncbi:MAG: TetR/AcrR family transcriptional regulator [Candidatus Marinimicrobia bacterium]|nr:TetR/AcrR family transcriptional regulator [Candidatus Neomarinimicrobiota bacterium]MBL7023483.1 TetR/AcrR family transcriptional regulator [Candidatus Neomarinimicrobiota bacterium]MBL7110251.1 TetR/AcrR family transcriptional regulator [Candidatus Neomarinimicrobiota bacterium]